MLPEELKRILADPEGARRDEAYERKVEVIADQIEECGEIEIGSLSAIRLALMLRLFRTDVGLTLAYRLGSRAGRRAPATPACFGSRCWDRAHA